MAKDNKISMPSGQGGLTRYFEESSSKTQFSPHVIVAGCVIVLILILVLHALGSRYFG